MDRRATAIIVAIAVAVLSLAAVVGVAAAVRGTDDDYNGMGMMDGSTGMMDGSMGMMGSMGGMDTGAMLEYMRGVLGDEAYQRMLQQMMPWLATPAPAASPTPTQ